MIHEFFLPHYEDIYGLTLMDLASDFFGSLAPGQTTKLRLPSDVTSQVAAWKWTLGCLQRQSCGDFGIHISSILKWHDMTWISFIDIHHMCFVIVIWLVCRIQRTLLLKSNALALSKWAACPAKVISSQRWHRRVASDYNVYTIIAIIGNLEELQVQIATH